MDRRAKKLILATFVNRKCSADRTQDIIIRHPDGRWKLRQQNHLQSLDFYVQHWGRLKEMRQRFLQKKGSQFLSVTILSPSPSWAQWGHCFLAAHGS